MITMTDDERMTIAHAADVIDDHACCARGNAIAGMRASLAAKLRAIAAPRPATATVGELLEPAVVVEFDFEGDWHQATRVSRLRYWQVRFWSGSIWSAWRDSDRRVDEAWCAIARTVSASDRDRDPATRGPLAGGAA